MTTDWAVGVRSPTEAEDFFLYPLRPSGCVAYAAFFTVGPGGYFSDGKARPERDADHSPPSTAEVKKE
jgi:hypothetical protein